tara:strand:+ start:2293 stop:2874 length:582 start_codon:yes stop_codon:yes gene_type:complete
MTKEDKIKKYGEGGGTTQGSGGSPGSASSSSSSNRNYYESPKKKKKKKKEYRDGGAVEWTEKDDKEYKRLVRQYKRYLLGESSHFPKYKEKKLRKIRKKHRQSEIDKRSFGEEFKRQRKHQEFLEKDDPTGETYKEKYREFKWRGKKYTARHKEEPKDKRKQKKKRYGGSVSYNSGSVRGYSKTYAGMGGDDE